MHACAGIARYIQRACMYYTGLQHWVYGGLAGKACWARLISVGGVSAGRVWLSVYLPKLLYIIIVIYFLHYTIYGYCFEVKTSSMENINNAEKRTADLEEEDESIDGEINGVVGSVTASGYHYRVYHWRWLLLATLCVLNVSNGMVREWFPPTCT